MDYRTQPFHVKPDRYPWEIGYHLCIMKHPSDSRAQRLEWLLIGALTFIGGCLRLWSFGRLGLTHFDEGIYAASGIWSLSPNGLSSLDPGVISYAPPGFPILVGIAYSLLGVADSSAIFVSIVVGTLTIPLMAWLGRGLLGPGGGVAAATFAALALVHVAFSRKALTDVSFLATWIFAIGLGSRFLERPSLLRGIAMGIAVGLAQNFKYNGWIAGVIVLIAAILGLILDREERKPARSGRVFGFGCVGAIVAALMYLPWYRFVEGHGGYAALLAHQRSYTGGFSSWFPHLTQQMVQVHVLTGGGFWGGAKWSVALACVAYLTRLQRKPLMAGSPLRLGCLYPRVLVAGMFLGWIMALGLLAGGALLIVSVLEPPSPRAISHRLLASWWLVLVVMTPFYHPYARLWLPLHSLDWLLFAALALWLVHDSATSMGDDRFSKLRLPHLDLKRCALLASFVLLFVWLGADATILGQLRPGPVSAFFQPTDSLRSAVANVASPDIEGKRLVPEGVSLKVLGRRPVVFYLGVLGQVPFRLLADRAEILNGPQPPNEWLLIDEAQFDQEGNSDEVWPLVLDRWRRVGSWETPLDPVTLLDVHPEAAWRRGAGLNNPRLWLFAPAP